MSTSSLLFFHRSGQALLSGLLLVLLPLLGWGQINVTTSGTAVIENFNTLASSGTSSTVPTGFAFVEAGTGADATYTAAVGSTANDTFSYGVASATDRAFGTLITNNFTSTIGASVKNNTGATITQLTISYSAEVWRVGTTGRDDRLDFQYSTTATSISAGTYVDVDALDGISPSQTAVASGTTGPLRTSNPSATITGLSIPNGAVFYIRWVDFNASGADDGIGVDDFSITATTAPSANITTGNPTLTGICADGTSTLSVPYTVTSGTPSGTCSVLLSDAAGNFSPGISLSTTSTTNTTSPLVVAIPTGLAGGAGYLVKAVVGSTTGSVNGTTFTINGVAVTPVAAQTGYTGMNGTTLTAAEAPAGSTITGRQWYYGTAAAGPYPTAITKRASFK